MKKRLIILFLCSFTCCGCSNTSTTLPTTVMSPETSLETQLATSLAPEISASSANNSADDAPLVSYDSITTGDYNESWVDVICVLDRIEYNHTINWFDFDVWISNDDGSYHPETNCHINMANDFEGKNFLDDIQNGDTVQIRTYVNKDTSFGFLDTPYMKIIESPISLPEIKDHYMEQCDSIPIEMLLRSPNDYKNTDVTFNGQIFQIIKQEESGQTAFLLDIGSDYGMVEILYTPFTDEERFLEGDSIEIYGPFYLLHDYVNVLGDKKTVPRIRAILINRS